MLYKLVMIVLCKFLTWILSFSAAHCLDNNGVRIKPEEVKVGLGQVSVNYSSNEPDSIIVSVSRLTFLCSLKIFIVRFLTHKSNAF